ncbi:hypothetical protein M4578_24300 [Salipiger sp. P9]|uniref:hypothetical protein n=1 Tax=Salipiger pentaromativorans TaxID=2943193 RepID=UPI002157CE55|nr:hypothetical protein [Salipiger pentaromativorans]MCR8550955.1 hypothetical protein [Salipiger pentaromativorans]
MFSSVALMGLLAVGLGWALVGSGDDGESQDEDTAEDLPETGDTTGTPPAEEPDETPTGGGGDSFFSLIDGLISGTDGDDEMTRESIDDSDRSASLRAGDGDDLIDLATGLSVYDSEWSGDVSGDGGNDTIEAPLAYGVLDGGDGDDEITAGSAGATILGGAGNDRIQVTDLSGEGFDVDGGEGDDTLIGERHGDLHGGNGNDSLEVSGMGSNAANYFVYAYGDEGDDALSYATYLPNADIFEEAHTLFGGAGSDTFEITISETDGTSPTPELSSHSDGTPRTFTVANIGDFESGTDVLMIESFAETATHTLTTARIVTTEAPGGGDPSYQLALRYEGTSDEDPYDVLISLGSNAIAWEDVVFAGEAIPELETAAA